MWLELTPRELETLHKALLLAIDASEDASNVLADADYNGALPFTVCEDARVYRNLRHKITVQEVKQNDLA